MQCAEDRSAAYDLRRQTDRFLTIKECAFMIGCHPVTIWRMVKSGAFPAPVKIGHLTRWSEIEVQTHLFQAKPVNP